MLSRWPLPYFLVYVYPGPLGIPETIPSNAPPAFLCVAADDRGAARSIDRLYQKYRESGASVLPHEAAGCQVEDLSLDGPIEVPIEVLERPLLTKGCSGSAASNQPLLPHGCNSSLRRADAWAYAFNGLAYALLTANPAKCPGSVHCTRGSGVCRIGVTLPRQATPMICIV